VSSTDPSSSETARESSSQSLQQVELAALEAAANSIVITDSSGTIEWVNPAFSRLSGYTRDEVLGQNPRLIKSGMHSAEFYKNLWDTILGGEVWHGEVINRRKDGNLYVEQMTITPVRAFDGTINHFVAVKEDVTARRQAEEALRQSEHRFHELA
jgi:PAS domain S-box-containing protein